MNISTYYRITRSVPFLDVDVHSDTRLFVDPHAVRLAEKPVPFAGQALQCMETFFHEITRCALNGRTRDYARGRDLLQHFEEPWETRLGLARNGFRGHGGAADVGSSIWRSFTTDFKMLIDVGIRTKIEDIPLFVQGVAADITSDLTTRIIYSPLAEFTANVMDEYPEFTAAGTTTAKVERRLWDPYGREWTTGVVELPVAGGKELLLVPRDWCRPYLLMSPYRYYETSLLSFAQSEQTTVTRNGRLLRPRKEDLPKQAALARGRATNLKVTLRAYENGTDLLRVFRAFVDSRYAPLTDEHLSQRLSAG